MSNLDLAEELDELKHEIKTMQDQYVHELKLITDVLESLVNELERLKNGESIRSIP